MTRRRDLEELAAKIRYDLTAAQGKLSELVRAIAALPADGDEGENPYRCPHCGPLANVKSQARLEEHLANVHAEGLDEAAPPPQLELEDGDAGEPTDENPAYGPGNPDWERDNERERALDGDVGEPSQLDVLLPRDPTARG